MVDHRAVTPGFGMMRIDFQSFRERFLSRIVLLPINKVIGKKQVTRDVIGIVIEGQLKRRNHRPAIAGRVSLSEAVVKLSVVWKLLQSVGENFRGELVIVLVQ